ncbi:MAG TPA: hypothetical protein DEA66_02565, partial [Flavobacteriales bacterium]|nr:hypothetical protein [Flavobacteriales bacterium]
LLLLPRLLPLQKKRREGPRNKLYVTRRNGPQKKHKLLPRLHRPRRLRKQSVALLKRQNAKRQRPLRSRRKRKMSKLRLTVERPRKKPQHQKDKPSVLRMQKHGRRNWMRMPQ